MTNIQETYELATQFADIFSIEALVNERKKYLHTWNNLSRFSTDREDISLALDAIYLAQKLKENQEKENEARGARRLIQKHIISFRRIKSRLNRPRSLQKRKRRSI